MIYVLCVSSVKTSSHKSQISIQLISIHFNLLTANKINDENIKPTPYSYLSLPVTLLKETKQQKSVGPISQSSYIMILADRTE